jgi:uncharacterized protein
MAPAILPTLQQVLCCPESHQPLLDAGAEVIARVNRAIQAGEVRNRQGEPVTGALERALIREDRRVLYPIRQGIPVLLSGAAIVLEAGQSAGPENPSEVGR